MTRSTVVSITAFAVTILAAVDRAQASAPWDFSKLREPPEMRWIDYASVVFVKLP
jgi:hypothetical protein